MSTSQTINGLQHYLPASSDAEFGGVLASVLAGMAYKQTALLVFSASSGLAASTTAYAVPGYGAASADTVSAPAPFSGKIVAAYARSRTAPSGDSVAIGVGGASDTSEISITLAEAATTGSGTSTSEIDAGNEIYVSVRPGASYSSGAADLTVSIVLVAA